MATLGTAPEARVRETSTSTGTGNVVGDGAKGNKDRTFLASYGGGTTLVPYMIAHQSMAEWEEGLATVQDDGTGSSEIVRGGSQTVTASSNGGSAVSFSSGTKDVFSPLSAEQGKALFEHVTNNRWTKEAEIDLSAQGNSFIVSDLPTNADILEFLFIDVNATSQEKLEFVLSDDNGSTFLTTTDYSSRWIDNSGTTVGNNSKDRWVLPDIQSVSVAQSLVRIHLYRFSTFGNTRPHFVATTTRLQSVFIVGGQFLNTTGSLIDAVKFMLPTADFDRGILQIWSA